MVGELDAGVDLGEEGFELGWADGGFGHDGFDGEVGERGGVAMVFDGYSGGAAEDSGDVSEEDAGGGGEEEVEGWTGGFAGYEAR